GSTGLSGRSKPVARWDLSADEPFWEISAEFSDGSGRELSMPTEFSICDAIGVRESPFSVRNGQATATNTASAAAPANQYHHKMGRFFSVGMCSSSSEDISSHPCCRSWSI